MTPPELSNAEPTDDSPTRLGWVILSASAGNALEWYDFSVFGYFAPQIAGAFFPGADPASALLLTFGTYGISFLARPIGAAVLGGYADRAGRRASLTVSILLMTFGTAVMALMPAYAVIGRWAPVGILTARLIQGFSAGGEFGSATAFMIEHAGRRAGFFGSFQFTSQAASAILGSGIGWALSATLSSAALNHWGFRLPFVFGLLIGPIGLYMRRHVAETPAFEAAKRTSAPLRRLLHHHAGRVALAACVVAAGTAGTYLNVYLPTYAHRHLHMAQSSSFAVAFMASLAPLVVTPIAAHLSDRIGRLPIMLWLAAALCAGSYPSFLLVAAYPTPVVLTCVLVGISILRAGYTAPSAALLSDMFPVDVRAAGLSLGYTLGVVAFGGFAQLALEWLIDATGNQTMPGLYMAATSLVTVIALLVIRRRVLNHP